MHSNENNDVFGTKPNKQLYVHRKIKIQIKLILEILSQQRRSSL